MDNKKNNEWMKQIFAIYDKMRARAIGDYYEAECNGLKLKVHKNVYSPDQFSDSTFFSNELPKIVANKSLLEIGAGTGIIGISCALNGAKVVMTDINPDAINVAKENVKSHDLNIPIIKSDIYDSLGVDEKFDYIFWSHPYNNWSEPVEDMLLRSGLDYKYNSLKKYIEGAKNHLTPNGRLLLGTGNSADLETMVKLADENNYSIRILKAGEMPLAFGDYGRIINMIFQFDPYKRQ
jgi:release factor glutamine methyltransferase